MAILTHLDSLSLAERYYKIYEEIEPMLTHAKVTAPSSDRVMSGEEAAKQLEALRTKWLRCKAIIYNEYPFFFKFLTQQKFIPTWAPSCPTMAVDAKGNIYCNISFGLNQLTEDEFVGVLMHECLHIMNFTFDRKGDRIHEYWNWATDYIMNRDLQADGVKLPSIGLLCDSNGIIPAKQLKQLFESRGIVLKKPVTDIDINKRSCEWLYDQIMDFIDINKTNQKKKEEQKGGQKAEDQGDGDPNSGGNEGDAGTIASGKPGTLDKHLEETSESPSPADPNNPDEQPNTEIKSSGQTKTEINDADTYAKGREREGQDARGGGGGQYSRSNVIEFHRPQVNWRRVLKEFVVKTVTDYSFARPSKRSIGAGYYGASKVKQPGGLDIVATIDTSGSIDKKDYSAFVTELMAIADSYPQVQIKILYWNETLYKEIDYSSVKRNKSEVINAQLIGGGNQSSCIKRYIDKKHIKASAIVHFCDGDFEDNMSSKFNCPSLFVLIPMGGEYRDDIVKKYGKVVRLKV